MRKRIIFIIIGIMFLFSGCSLFTEPNTNLNLWDGILRNEQGGPVVDDYNLIPTIDHFENGIHKGYAFTSRINNTIAGGTTYYAIYKSDGREVHFSSRRINVVDLSNQVIDFEFRIWENVSVTTNGTAVPIFNLNRGSNNTNTLLGFVNPTGISYVGSTLLSPFGNRIKADRKSSETTSQELEYIMNTDTYYLIEMINYGLGDIEMTYDLLWTEEEH